MNGNKVKVMAQGAMLASLFGVLGVINLYTGSIFDIVLAYVMVIGLVYYTYLYDYRAGLSVLAVTFVILFLVGELFFTFYVTFTLVNHRVYPTNTRHPDQTRSDQHSLTVSFRMHQSVNVPMYPCLYRNKKSLAFPKQSRPFLYDRLL